MPKISWESLCSVSFPVERALQPAVLIACRYRRVWHDPVTVERHCLHAWVIDCSLTPGLRLRSPRADSPWIERAAGVIHVYAPGTAFWENNAAVAGRRLNAAFVIFADAGRRLAPLTAPGGGVARIADTSGRLAAALTEPFAGAQRPSRWRCQAALCRCLDLLAQAEHVSGDAWTFDAPPGARPLSDLVDQWLEQHLAQRATVTALARHLTLAPSTLAHRYRAECANTPMRRLAELRVRCLQALLARGDRLAEAALACGFCDAFHASRRFRAVTGLTPTAWLASLRGG